MTANRDAFEAMLASMRADFLADLVDRCSEFERLILDLEDAPGNREVFDELYRGVHSVKGSGGTHGLPMVTTLCHQLEDLLTEASSQKSFDTTFVTQTLSLVDLLRQVVVVCREPKPDYSAIEAALDAQRRLTEQQCKLVMLAESSKVMSGLCQRVLETQALRLTVVEDGLIALRRLLNEPYDLIVVGRELQALNGLALVSALRASDSPNRRVPVVMITSNRQNIPPEAGVTTVLARDQKLMDTLLHEVRVILNI